MMDNWHGDVVVATLNSLEETDVFVKNKAFPMKMFNNLKEFKLLEENY